MIDGRPTIASTLNADDDVALLALPTAGVPVTEMPTVELPTVMKARVSPVAVTGRQMRPRPRPTCFNVLGRTPAHNAHTHTHRLHKRTHAHTPVSGSYNGVVGAILKRNTEMWATAVSHTTTPV